MKRAAIFAMMATAALAGSAPADEVTDLLRKAYKDYTSGELAAMTETLREITRLADDRKEIQLAKVLPNRVGEFLGLPMKSEHLAKFGGGVALERTYVHGTKMVTAKIVKDSPLADAVMKLLANDDLVAWSGAKVHTVDGEQAILDGKGKLMMAVDGKVYLELQGNESVRDADLVSFARKLEIRELRKMK